MNRIIVTGANGYIGSRLVRYLKDKGYETVAVSRHDDACFIGTDYSADQLCSILKKDDIVVHLAAVRSGKTASDFKDNIVMTKSILDSMLKTKANRMVFISSIAVYSALNSPFKEDQSLCSSSLYGESKIQCEDLCRTYAEENGIKVQVLRFPPVYGPYSPNRRALETFVDQAKSNKTIILTKETDAKRDFLYIEDAIYAIEKIIETDPERYEVYNISNGNPLNNSELAKIINYVYENKEPVVYDDTKHETITDAYMDNSKIISKGISDFHEHEEAFKEIRIAEEN